MARNPIANLIEVEYIMNARFTKSVMNEFEELRELLEKTPATAEVFLYKNKSDWIDELNATIKDLKEIQNTSNKNYFSQKGL